MNTSRIYIGDFERKEKGAHTPSERLVMAAGGDSESNGEKGLFFPIPRQGVILELSWWLQSTKRMKVK